MGLFKPATRKQLKARVLFTGPAKGGKSMSGLRLAMALARHEATLAGRKELRVAAIDTENRSLSKYVGLEFDGMKINFDVAELAPGAYAPQTFIDLMRSVYKTHDVVFIDSTSAEWQGTGGVMDIVDKAAAKSRSKSTFSEGWKVGGPEHQKFVDEIIACPIHIICTARSKMAYEQKKDSEGKTSIVKLGLEPIQRETTPFEFDIIADMDSERNAFISGRCHSLKDRKVYEPGALDWKPFIEWLHEGEEDTSQATPRSIDPAVLPPNTTVETTPPPPKEDKAEVLASIRAKRMALGEPESKEAEWANAYQPGATKLEQLPLANLANCNEQLSAKVQAIAKGKIEKAVAAAEATLKPTTSKLAKLNELFAEFYGDDIQIGIEGTVRKRGGRPIAQWSDDEVADQIGKLEHALTTRDMEKGLASGK